MNEEFSVPDPVDQVRQFVEAANRVAANRGELDAVPSYLARDSVWDTSRVGIGVFEGVATIRRFLEDWFGSYEELQVVIDELLDVGSGVVLTVTRQMARPVGTTGYIQQREGWVWVWVDGLCASVTVYPEALIDEARAAAERLAEERGKAMSQENVELVRSISAAHERGDYGSAEWAHPDIEYVIVGGPTPGIWKGRAAMARAAGELLSAWDENRTVVEEVRSLDGERVLVLGHGGGRGKASGVELDGAQWQVAALYQVRGGKVIRHVVYLDRADAFADLGLEE